MLAEQVIRNLKTMSISALCVTGCLLLAACGGGGGGGATATAALDGAATPAVVSAAAPTSGSLVVTASAPMPVAAGGAVGGSGATCNPSTAGWPSCTKATILVKQNGYITKTVHISGGHLSSAMTLNTANTEYILDGDITADGTAFSIAANYVYLNLNGYTITYNQTVSGHGVTVSNYNYHDIAIANGSIIQGAANSAGTVYGLGNNPINTKTYIPQRVQVANIYARFSGQDVGGFQLGGDDAIVEQCTVEDTYGYGTVVDRHSGNPAIHLWGTRGIVRNSTIINTRQKGIEVNDYANIYGNHISIRSICTNSIGIGAGSNSNIYNNNIYGRGEMPVGIAVGNTTPSGFVSDPTEVLPMYVPAENIYIYNNVIDQKVTGLGLEYGSSIYPGSSTLLLADTSGAIRSTTGIRNLHVHDNNITVYSDADFIGTWSLTGEPVRIQCGARGIWLGLRWNGHSAYIYNNTINAIDREGSGTVTAAGIVVSANIDNRYWYADRSAPRRPDFHPDLQIYWNTVTSNSRNLLLGDGYGPSDGFPLIYQNTFKKSGSFSTYRTMGVGLSMYDHATGILLSNVYVDGASESSMDFKFEALSDSNSYREKSFLFGRLMSGTVRDASNNLLSGVQMKILTQVTPSFTVALTTTTNTSGVAPLYVYDYELNNNQGTTGSSTPIEVLYQPHAIELGSLLLTPYVTGSLAWDALTSSGSYTYSYTESGGSWQ